MPDMKLIPEKYRDLVSDDTRAFAFLATLMPDGSPQVTPVWFNVEGELILINSAKGRVKDLNMRARPHVALAIIDMKNPYRYLQVRGRVVEFTEEGAAAHFDKLYRKYTEREQAPPRPGEVRVIYKIYPDKVVV
jgi:PPOX class probable F420-dependent enzyme